MNTFYNGSTLVLDIPDERNVYFVGDIHANTKLFDYSLYYFDIKDDDIIISTGDIVDRGNNNPKILFDFLFNPNRFMVLGNHEELMINESHSKSWRDIWLQNGGDATLQQLGYYGVNFFQDKLRELPLFIEVNHRGKKIGVCHGGIPYDDNNWSTIQQKSSNTNYRESILWDRSVIDSVLNNKFIEEIEYINGIDCVIHGHTGVKSATKIQNRIYIDTQFESGDFTFLHVDINGNLQTYQKENDSFSFRRNF